MSFAKYEPRSLEESIQDQRWKDAMDEEIKVIRKNDTWELKSFSKLKKVIGVRQSYKAKKNIKGEEKYKMRLLAKRHKQQQSIHYVNNKFAIAL